MEDTISAIVTGLETHEPNSQTPISLSTLLNLQTLLDFSLKSNNSLHVDRLFDELSAVDVSPSSLINPITVSLESGSTRISLLAANVYLSLLLSPNAPVFSLFTPVAFLSLLRSIRRALKNPVQHSGKNNPTRKKKGVSRLNGRTVGEDEEERGGDGSGKFDVRALFIVFERLEMVIDLIHLDRFPDTLKNLIQTVVEIPVIRLEMFGNCGSYGKLCDVCGRILGGLFKGEHGDLGVTAYEVLKCMVPLILMNKVQVREFALGFVVGKMMGMAKDNVGINDGIVRFLRFLVCKAPEKAEPRAAAVESVLEIVRGLGFDDQVGFVDFVVKMGAGQFHFRLLGVDLCLALMLTLGDPFDMKLDNRVETSWGWRCLEAMIKRCSDCNATIRARALSNLAQLMGSLSKDDVNCSILKKVMGFDTAGHIRQDVLMANFLRKRCVDEKAGVRKAALILMSKLTGLLGGAVDVEVLRTMGMSCSDPLVSIRKAAISALSEVFRTFRDENVTKEWLRSVPRLIIDSESSIQEECENLFLELVLDRISKAGSISSSKGNKFSIAVENKKCVEKEMELLFPEGVLGLLREICNEEVTPWVKNICTSLGKKKRLKPRIAIALQNIIKSSESLWLSHSKPIEKWTAPLGAWFLLSEVSGFLPKSVDFEFLHHHWKLLDKHLDGGKPKCSLEQGESNEGEKGVDSNSVSWAGDRVFLLQTISNVSVELPPDPAADLAHNLLERLQEFNMHPTEVDAHANALKTLCTQQALDAEEADSLVMEWVCKLLSNASEVLDAYMSKDLKANTDGSFFTPPNKSRKGKRAETTMSRLLRRAITAVHTIGSSVIICPSADVQAIVPKLHRIITSGSSGSKFDKLLRPAISIKLIAPSLYIHAWLAMGKICLADGKLATRYIPLFVEELEKSDSAPLRSDIIVVMTDFCVRYTALVDSHISKITKCLRDPNEIVRRQTFILFCRLLQSDYVKWRGVLFLRFLVTLVDESKKVRRLADFVFGNILKAKAPLLAYNSFVEAVFVLNDCRPHTHTGYSSSQSSRSETQLFTIRGNDEKSRSQRMHIYITLLKQMAPEHLLATFAKVCVEILAAVSDGLLNIEDAIGRSVLQDAFQILSCKEIRIQANRGPSSDSADMGEEGGDTGRATASSAGRGKVTPAFKKGVIQNTIPVFIELKKILESKNSPLIGSLMECLRVTLRDYKNEIEDILVGDRQLQKELIYDMQKYETTKANLAAARVVASMQKSDSYRSPGDPKDVNGSSLRNTSSAKEKSNPIHASALANARAEATVRSVLREVKRGAATPPLSSMSVPRLKTSVGGASSRGKQPPDVIESLRRRQTFDSDEDN